MPDEPMFARGIYSLPDAARRAGCSPSVFYRMARAGTLPFRVEHHTARFSNGYAVDGGSLKDWLAARQQEVRL